MTTGPADEPIDNAMPEEGADPDLAVASPIPARFDDEPEPPPVPQQREDLAETLDELHARLNVKERARAEVGAQTDHLRQQATDHRTALIAAGGAIAAAAAVAIVLRRRR